MNNYELFHNSLKTNYFAWQKFLDAWLGRNYLREVLFGYGGSVVRKKTSGTNQLIKQMMYFADPRRNLAQDKPNPHIWVSVYKFRADNGLRPDYSSAIIDKMLFDFDADVAEDVPTIHELRQPYNDAMSVQYSGATALLSGRKGFQAHYPINATEKELEAVPLRDRHIRIDALYGFQAVDEQVHGDYARVCRLPFSVHPVSQLQAVIVRKGESLESVYERAKQFQPPGWGEWEENEGSK